MGAAPANWQVGAMMAERKGLPLAFSANGLARLTTPCPPIEIKALFWGMANPAVRVSP